ncbi:MAG: hypothetical protein ABIT38_12415 [Gemmatimonadaceae bacterium]
MIQLHVQTADERVRRADLTPAGRLEVDEMNRRSDVVAERILATLTPSKCERLVKAMDEVHQLLRFGAVRIERVDPASDDARWCVAQYFAELARRFDHGFDPEQSIPAADADLRPPLGAFLVATAEGKAVACGAVRTVRAPLVRENSVALTSARTLPRYRPPFVVCIAQVLHSRYHR